MIDLEARGRALNERGVVQPAPVETVLSRARRYRNRRRFTTAAIAACVAMAGVVGIAWASNSHGRANDLHTIDSPGPVPKPATALAHQLLERAVLPPGTAKYDGAPPAIIDIPWEAVQSPNLVDLHQLWIAPTSDATVLAYLRTHTPAALEMSACCGSSGGPGDRVDNVTFDRKGGYPTTGPVVSAQLLVSVTARTATTTWVRVDAQVVWRPRRDPTTLVPASDRVVTIAMAPDQTADGRTPLPRVITDRAVVERLVREFNRLPTVPDFVSNGLCDEIDYDVGFARGRADRPDVTAHTLCRGVRGTGSGGSTLLSAGAFVDDVNAVFARLGP